MTSVLQTVETQCKECYSHESTTIEVFEIIPLDELQGFVDNNFVAPCKKCAKRSWNVLGFFGYAEAAE